MEQILLFYDVSIVDIIIFIIMYLFYYNYYVLIQQGGCINTYISKVIAQKCFNYMF